MKFNITETTDGYTVSLPMGKTYTNKDLEEVITKIRYEYRLFLMPLGLVIKKA